MKANGPVYVIGDVHGQVKKVVALLRGAGLVGDDLAWAGGTAALWFLGDFFDRGPDGVGVVDLVMRLQREAVAAGGRVSSLLGNHEVMLLAAKRFGDLPPEGATRATNGSESAKAQPRQAALPEGPPDYELRLIWEDAGGRESDLERLTPQHVEWLTRLPAMAHEEGYLLVHANSLFYLEYGAEVEEVNAAIRAILQGDDAARWTRLIEGFRTRGAFNDELADGKALALQFLQRFGGQRLVHGHVPVPVLTRQIASEVREPLVYAGGLCINVDGGLSLGGPGFVYQLPG